MFQCPSSVISHHHFARHAGDASISASLSKHSAAPCSMPDLITASRISCDAYSTLTVSVPVPLVRILQGDTFARKPCR